MSILLVEDWNGRIEAIPRYSGAASGDLVASDNAKVNAVADLVKGIVVDAVPTDTPPAVLKLAGRGCVIEDTVLNGVAAGQLIWSTTGGAMTTTEPTVAAAAKKCLVGVVRRLDTRGTNTGCEILLICQLMEYGGTT